MDIYGAGKNGTRVEVNGDFSILIPYGSCNGIPVDGLRFFLPVSIHQEMINDENKVADVSVFQKGDSYSIDVIEQPIHCNVIKTEVT